ncbi:MAG: hypothetical protein CMG91_10110 [Marinobacter sp.]|mgnify:CR=1 FL=1|nr:hypothetical protein [Marinobacter sp.]OUW81137.1 MAG: hypothetical protein CBD74_08710 [Saprospirales bacterium TMED214]|tara:strand:- start:6646 stop:7365 length:720 start_codon:yes stop_codon:yes gene_type:complete
MMPGKTLRIHRTLFAFVIVGVAGVTAGCATGISEDLPVPRACTSELSGLTAYMGDDCRTCENVHFAAPGEPRRCGLDGVQPGVEASERSEPRPEPEPNDSDNDGVIDRLDECPDSPAGADVLSNGCEQVELKGVVFALDSADLLPGAEQALENQLGILRRGDLRVEIGGHTDSQGASEYNRNLSLRRARTVRDFFVDNGIDPARLTVQGYGESEPRAANDTETGRERNRRVELRVLGRQ